jgi:hypothetical protein
MKCAAFKCLSVWIVGIGCSLTPTLLAAGDCKCPHNPGPGGGVQCAKDQIATCDPSSGECNCTCDSVERGKSKEEYEALILSRTLHTTVSAADLSSPQYHKLVSSFRKGEDEDQGTFYFEKETGSDRKARVKVGVPEWLESVLAGKGAVLNGPGASLQNCPNGICIGGDNSGTATVYNFTPPARRLSEDQRKLLTACLRLRPGRFSIAAIANNAEAYSYAHDWHDVLVAAGWEIEHKDIPINIFTIGGGMWTGIRVSVHGTMVGTDKAYVVDNSPEKKFYECVGGKAQIVATIIPYEDIPTGSVRINISARE